jgi:hypothetical protein
MPPALISQSKAFTKSIQTAFFILLMPEFPSAFSLIYILPNKPKSAIQRMKRMVSQTKRRGTLTVKGKM